jgi:hypothetical protein
MRLVRSDCADKDRPYTRLGERELNRGRLDRNTVASAEGVQPGYVLELLPARRAMVQSRAGRRTLGEDARVERACEDDINAMPLAGCERLREGGLVEKV